MTTEEAIKWLINERDNHINNGVIYETRTEAINMAIKALGQEPCEDAISRKALKARMFDMAKPNTNKTYWDGVDDVGDLIDNLPSVQPMRPKGKWVRISNGCRQIYACSKCGRTIEDDTLLMPVRYPFCHCGADMRETE